MDSDNPKKVINYNFKLNPQQINQVLRYVQVLQANDKKIKADRELQNAAEQHTAELVEQKLQANHYIEAKNLIAQIKSKL